MKNRKWFKRWVCLVLAFLITIISGCTSSNSYESKVSEPVLSEPILSEEEFEKLYDEIMTNLDSLNMNSEYVGAIHSEIWNNVGVEDVVSTIEQIRSYYNSDSFEYYDTIVATAFGVSMFNEYDTHKALEYVDTYMNALSKIESLLQVLDQKYTELNRKYGSLYSIDDLKDYYIESIAYAEYACEVDGSYVSYNQALNQFKTNISKLKKAAEISN